MTKMAIASRRFVGTRWLPAFMLVAALPAAASAQGASASTIPSPLRITATAGGLAPRSALVVDPLAGGDTRIAAAPAFGLEVQYEVLGRASLFGGGAVSFSSLEHGTNLGVTARGASSAATVIIATGGLFLDAPTEWFGSGFRPTLRVGGGLKRYSFSTPGSSASIAGTGDFGLGFRSGTQALELSAEVRYLPGTFDQAKLPTRGLVPQKQQQNDILFGIGVTFRP